MELLDHDQEDIRATTNHKKWSFKLFIYYVIIQLVVAYLVSNYAFGIDDPVSHTFKLIILGILSKIILLIGALLIYLSYKNNEKRDYQYQVAFWGFVIIILLYILPYCFSYLKT